MDFNPYIEDEVFRGAVSQRLDRPLDNPPNKFWRDSTQTKNKTLPFQTGDSIRYTNKGKHEMVELVDIKPTTPDHKVQHQVFVWKHKGSQQGVT